MNEILKSLFGLIIDTTVVIVLLIFGLILAAIAFIFYPIKGIRIFIGKQIKRIADTIDYFLNSMNSSTDE